MNTKPSKNAHMSHRGCTWDEVATHQMIELDEGENIFVLVLLDHPARYVWVCITLEREGGREEGKERREERMRREVGDGGREGGRKG